MSNLGLFKRRLGKFYIDTALIESSPGTVFEILSTVIVVRAEMRWDMDAIEYIGISHSFECLPCGRRVPEYKAIFEQGRFTGWVNIDN